MTHGGPLWLVSGATPVFTERAIAHGDAGNILAIDAESHAALLARGTTHLTPWDVLDDAGVEHDAFSPVWREAIDAWSEEAAVRAHGLDLMSLARYRHARWAARLLWATLVVRAAIARLRPARVHAHIGPGEHAMDAPDHAGKPGPVLLAAAAAADLAGVPVQLTSDGLARDDATSTPVPALIDSMSAHAAARPRYGPDPASLAEPHVLMVGNGPEVNALCRVAAELRRLGGPPSVVVSKTGLEGEQTQAFAGAMVWAEAAYWRAARGGDRPWADRAINADDEAAPIASGAIDRFLAGAGRGPLAAVLRHPLLRGHLAFLFGPYARAMARQAEGWASAFEAGGAIALVTAYPAPVVDVAAARGVPTLVLPHGPMITADVELYRTLPATTLIGAACAAHLRTLARSGVEASRTVLTGVPGSNFGDAPEPSPAIGATAPATDGAAGATGRILLMTAETAAFDRLGGPPPVRFDRDVRTLSSLAAAAREHGWRITVRPHPRFDRPAAFYQRVCGAETLIDDGARRPRVALSEALASSHVAVVLGGPSSSLLDGASAAPGTPVILHAGSMVFRGPEAWGLESWPRADDDAALVATLDACVTSPARRAELAERTRTALAAFRGHDPGLATPLAAQAVLTLANAAPRARCG